MLRKPVWRHIRRQSPKKATIKELRGEIKELEGDIKELQEEKVYQSEAGSCLVSNNRDSSDATVWLLWGVAVGVCTLQPSFYVAARAAGLGLAA